MSEELRPLKLFNEKAYKLLSSKFAKFVSIQGILFKYRYRKGEGVSINTQVPDEHSIDEFALTLRFFIQDNEPCSFRKMAETYEKLNLPAELKKEYFDTRQKLNNYLDSLSMEFRGENVTKRMVLWTFMYGTLAHAEVEKEKALEEWMRRDHLRIYLPFEFSSVLREVLETIQHVSELNTRAIHELTQKNRQNQC